MKHQPQDVFLINITPLVSQRKLPDYLREVLMFINIPYLIENRKEARVLKVSM